MNIFAIMLGLALVLAIVFTIFAPVMSMPLVFRAAGICLPIVVMILARFSSLGWLIILISILIEVGTLIFVFMNKLM